VAPKSWSSELGSRFEKGTRMVIASPDALTLARGALCEARAICNQRNFAAGEGRAGARTTYV
jgi:hypothetical protein